MVAAGEDIGITVFDVRRLLSLPALDGGPGERAAMMQIVKALMSLRPSWRCRGSLEVVGSAAEKGYGPMIYDMAMTLAKREGRPGIIADRKSVSTEARRVWEFSAERRGDVRTEAPGWACARHGDPVLDQIYALDQDMKGYSALLRRGRETMEILGEQLGDANALMLLADARVVFWNCHFHSSCPGPDPREAMRPARRRAAS